MAVALYVIAGELSGDAHGAGMLRALRSMHPNLEIHGAGGPEMRAVAGPGLKDWVEDAAVMGLWEVLKRYGWFKQRFAEMLAEVKALKPKILVLIDYPGFNLRFAAEGLMMLHPYRPGRVPIVLVHGTASSPARWTELINELENDPTLGDRIQIWLFLYATGNPVAYSAGLLRAALEQARADLDPGGRDAALDRMVVIGHSQGGLLTKLMAVESGDAFWTRVSDEPLESLDLEPKTRKLAMAWRSTQASPSFLRTRTAVGEMPRWVTAWRSTISQRRSGAGWLGAPSKITKALPSEVAPIISQGPIIQPMSVSQKKRSSRLRSM